MKFRKHTVALFLLIALSAETGFRPLSAQTPHKGLKKGANIGLNITNNKKNPPRTYFNIGLWSNFAGLNGVSLNAISSIVHHNVQGIQLSGFLNISGLDANGFQLAGIANVTGKNSHGVALGGLMNVHGKDAKGIQIGGLGNVGGKSLKGLSVAGLMNISGKQACGLQVAGLANVNGENLCGVAFAGLMNAAAGTVKGVQLSSLINIAGKENKGIQLAGLGNVSVKNRGVQVGFSNYSEENQCLQVGFGNVGNKGNGVQIGVVNVCGAEKTRQLGLFNFTPNTRTQLIVSGGNSTLFNVGVRFKNKFSYSQIGTGIYQLGADNDFSLSGFYRTGLYLPLTPRLELSGDLGYYHIESFDNRHQGFPDRLYAIQPRINLEYAVNRKVALFASGGYEWKFRYRGGKLDDKAVFEIGVALF